MGVTGWQRQEQRHQEDLQRLQGFRPIDDTFMRQTVPERNMTLRCSAQIMGQTHIEQDIIPV